ncbi:hypothetical protein B0H19DRAFT_1264336 [Mycena capillaripes]|nr:hypothetical protein B0H19DRAFT_1264336 [Mycena capillaripes]
MQFKSLLLPLLILASSSSIHASTTAIKTFGDRDVDLAIGGRTLVARTTSTTNTGITGTSTKTVTTPTATSTSGSSADCCTCLKAAAAEGFACAAAILEEGCNIIADISCVLDFIAFGEATSACLHCAGF